jgi:preprotein translocase subunit SecG
MCRRFSRSFREAAGRLYNRVFRFSKNLMLYYLAVTIYIIVCLTLVMVVLLQQGKGGGMANAFGGGGSSQAAFGARSGATVLSRATTVCAVLFVVGALLLGIMGQRGPGSVVGGRSGPVPASTQRPTPPAPAVPTQTPGTTTAPAPAPAPAK